MKWGVVPSVGQAKGCIMLSFVANNVYPEFNDKGFPFPLSKYKLLSNTIFAISVVGYIIVESTNRIIFYCDYEG